MSNVQIKDLITVTPTGADLVPISQEGKTRSATVDEIRDKSLRTEVENARGNAVNLKARLDANDTQLSDVAHKTGTIQTNLNADMVDGIQGNQIPLKTTAIVTYYVATTGLDTNDGLTNGTAFKTITKALDMIPQIVNHAVTINVASGTYAEDIITGGFAGKGTITLKGGSTLNDSYIINSFNLINCRCRFFVQGFKAISTTTHGFNFSNCRASSYFNKVADVTANTTYYGFCATEGAIIDVDSCLVTNRFVGLYSKYMSILYSTGNTGTGNSYALYCDTASTIGKNSSQPSGTTAETTNAGGVIR